MHAVVMHETGGPDVLRYEEPDRPEPGDGEVLIRVRAASVNAIDWKYRRGYADKQLPAVLGNDMAGTVEASRAEGFAEGDEVFGFAASGGYAEFATASATGIVKKPAGVSHEQAAAIPVAGLTAWQALFDRGRLERGQTALIAGAAGGVGHFAVQFAKVAAVRAIGVGSSRNRDFVLGLGAEEYVDYTQQDVGEAVSGVDVAFDAVGGETTQSLLPTVREGGLLVTIANAPPEAAARERGARAELLVMSPSTEQLSRIAQLVADGDVRVEIAELVPLTEVRRAHELSESGHTRGKIILTVGCKRSRLPTSACEGGTAPGLSRASPSAAELGRRSIAGRVADVPPPCATSERLDWSSSDCRSGRPATAPVAARGAAASGCPRRRAGVSTRRFEPRQSSARERQQEPLPTLVVLLLRPEAALSARTPASPPQGKRARARPSRWVSSGAEAGAGPKVRSPSYVSGSAGAAWSLTGIEAREILGPPRTGGDRMVVQLVRASIKPEQRDRWLEVIERNAADTRAEEGCEGYQVAEDVERPNTFVIVELWTDLEAVYTHFRNQFEGLMSALGDVFAAPPEASIHEVATTLTLDEVLAAAGIAR